ncbi:OmpW family outer membrane protein [Alteromonas halophila]|uniref:Outer membrane protein OmpW n=1 Tax=Alteromonas halophila TaxID=516698 RepID=A0A918N1V4_9ALTE|nr:OmpW family outer membrane protein [Alteromonas halophila]GGW96181.1 outer membrane protein OmpW [Alteromonas halophila]
MKKQLLALAISAAVFSPFTFSHQAGDILVRAGATTVAPDESTSNIFAGGADLGVALTIDKNTQLGLNIAYFLTDNINVELLAATPFTHDVNFSVNDPLGTGNKVGEVTHLPPTLSVNYYFNDPSSAFQPYVGAGLNYTFIYDEEFTGANRDAGLSDLSLDNSAGLSAQVGMDYMVNKTWHVNASVRWIDIDTEASFDVGGADGRIADIEIDPWVYTISVGYTF